MMRKCRNHFSVIHTIRRNVIPNLHTNKYQNHQVFQRRRKASRVDSYSLLRALKSRGNPSMKTEGIQIHQLVITLGFNSVVFIQTALITMYSESVHMDDAHKLLDEMSSRTCVGWTALILGYVNNHKPNIALSLFRQMQLEKVEPDLVTMTVVLLACADAGALESGKWVHAYIRRQGIGEDHVLTNALINMYCKCGDIAAARQLFETLPEESHDVTTWTSIITGYALHGRAPEALELFNRMKSSRTSWRPNSVTFVGILTACSHAGLVEVGKMHWENMMRVYNVKPNMTHYGYMVDLLCRAGQIEEAYEFIETMPVKANAIIWRNLMGACSMKGNVKIGSLASRRLLELEPECVGDGVIMSNFYASAGKWEEKERIRRRKGRRAPGCSLIEIESVVHEFVAGDKRHVNNVEIRQVLKGMVRCSMDMYGMLVIGNSKLI